VKRIALAALAASVPLAGCTVTAGEVGISAACDREGWPAQSVVLMAQAVPSAPVLPCLRQLPTGWRFAELDVRNGAAEFTLASDRAGPRAVIVRLTATCDVTGASAGNSDEPGLLRYERTGPGGNMDTVHYVAAGGCITYRFDLPGGGLAYPGTEAATALDFVSREKVRAKVRHDSGGRLELDPPAGESR
jgi:hypothetical protein